MNRVFRNRPRPEGLPPLGSYVDHVTGSKVCKLCSLRKFIKDFHPNKVCSQGVVGTCKDCSVYRIRKWYSDNRVSRRVAANSRNQLRRDQSIEALGGKCFDCDGVFHRSVYDFHHRDAATKIDAVSNLLGKPDKLKEELTKCDLLCANCHRLRHFKEGT